MVDPYNQTTEVNPLEKGVFVRSEFYFKNDILKTRLFDAFQIELSLNFKSYVPRPFHVRETKKGYPESRIFDFWMPLFSCFKTLIYQHS